ncbi:hypothetical protein SSPSH_001895 [Salinisphaera shabanensis E1L3A]|uniref:Uncharacterized protein n=1 Tax=Salinisphaera shabanensis E1L3A TaxID=1033802 RepID=U2E5K1_9GAMM|nr:hypothetical protein SSPSH_001895 [Salinisphaera shabanensis E1L3A]
MAVMARLTSPDPDNGEWPQVSRHRAVNPKMKRSNSMTAYASLLMLALVPLGISPLLAQPAGAPSAGSRASVHGHGGYDPHACGGYRHSGPEIQIYMDPESEHWPSNYVPDNYRLDGYDGEPDRATICRGESGRTYTTRTIECPAGQQADEPARTWSTSP